MSNEEAPKTIGGITESQTPPVPPCNLQPPYPVRLNPGLRADVSEVYYHLERYMFACKLVNGSPRYEVFLCIDESRSRVQALLSAMLQHFLRSGKIAGNDTVEQVLFWLDMELDEANPNGSARDDDF